MLSWQQILSQGFAKAQELLEFLGLPITDGDVYAEQQFKTRVPRGFAARMQPGRRDDPLLLQVLAVSNELHTPKGFVQDPLEEATFNAMPGLIHKYHGRVLLTLTGACAIHCRYCFRRHFPYQENNPGRMGWSSVINYIANDLFIHEVIFSGGDPLLASDAVLSELCLALAEITHVKTLRIHTRIPIVLPERVTEELLNLFKKSRFQVIIVLHSNHAQELDESVAVVCRQLRDAGCLLLNQSVLLSTVNDHAETLADLSHRLFACGVLPYYLHLMDKVQGAAHFDVDVSRARVIFQQLQSILPGYLVPRLSQEIAGKKNKTLIV